jgi:opacity protein-like surface antigen
MEIKMKYLGAYLTILGFLMSSSAYPSKLLTSSASKNQTGFFLGIGSAYDKVKVEYNHSGVLNATEGIPPLGLFSGTANFLNFKAQTLSPEIQAGYLHPIATSNWVWGLKLVYKKLSHVAAETELNLLAPNIKTTDLVNMSTIYTNNELAIPALIGHSFMNGFVYLGGGASIRHIEHSTYNNTDTLSGYYIGTIGELSNAKWLLGSAIHAGLTYYLNPIWFLDFNYTYASTGWFTGNNSVSFMPEGNGGLNSGTFFFSKSQRFSTQAMAISVNTVFN